MLVVARLHELTRGNLTKAPIGPGVYGLYRRDAKSNELIYVGGCVRSVRDRLERHLLRNGKACARAATHFSSEALVAEDVPSRQASLITQFQDTIGRLPRCNDPRC
jgi:hypothetical protein